MNTRTMMDDQNSQQRTSSSDEKKVASSSLLFQVQASFQIPNECIHLPDSSSMTRHDHQNDNSTSNNNTIFDSNRDDKDSPSISNNSSNRHVQNATIQINHGLGKISTKNLVKDASRLFCSQFETNEDNINTTPSTLVDSNIISCAVIIHPEFRSSKFPPTDNPKEQNNNHDIDDHPTSYMTSVVSFPINGKQQQSQYIYIPHDVAIYAQRLWIHFVSCEASFETIPTSITAATPPSLPFSKEVLYLPVDTTTSDFVLEDISIHSNSQRHHRCDLDMHDESTGVSTKKNILHAIASASTTHDDVDHSTDHDDECLMNNNISNTTIQLEFLFDQALDYFQSNIATLDEHNGIENVMDKHDEIKKTMLKERKSSVFSSILTNILQTQPNLTSEASIQNNEDNNHVQPNGKVDVESQWFGSEASCTLKRSFIPTPSITIRSPVEEVPLPSKRSSSSTTTTATATATLLTEHNEYLMLHEQLQNLIQQQSYHTIPTVDITPFIVILAFMLLLFVDLYFLHIKAKYYNTRAKSPLHLMIIWILKVIKIIMQHCVKSWSCFQQSMIHFKIHFIHVKDRDIAFGLFLRKPLCQRISHYYSISMQVLTHQLFAISSSMKILGRKMRNSPKGMLRTLLCSRTYILFLVKEMDSTQWLKRNFTCLSPKRPHDDKQRKQEKTIPDNDKVLVGEDDTLHIGTRNHSTRDYKIFQRTPHAVDDSTFAPDMKLLSTGASLSGIIDYGSSVDLCRFGGIDPKSSKTTESTLILNEIITHSTPHHNLSDGESEKYCIKRRKGKHRIAKEVYDSTERTEKGTPDKVQDSSRYGHDTNLAKDHIDVSINLLGKFDLATSCQAQHRFEDQNEDADESYSADISNCQPKIKQNSQGGSGRCDESINISAVDNSCVCSISTSSENVAPQDRLQPQIHVIQIRDQKRETTAIPSHSETDKEDMDDPGKPSTSLELDDIPSQISEQAEATSTSKSDDTKDVSSSGFSVNEDSTSATNIHSSSSVRSVLSIESAIPSHSEMDKEDMDDPGKPSTSLELDDVPSQSLEAYQSIFFGFDDIVGDRKNKVKNKSQNWDGINNTEVTTDGKIREAIHRLKSSNGDACVSMNEKGTSIDDPNHVISRLNDNEGDSDTLRNTMKCNGKDGKNSSLDIVDFSISSVKERRQFWLMKKENESGNKPSLKHLNVKKSHLKPLSKSSTPLVDKNKKNVQLRLMNEELNAKIKERALQLRNVGDEMKHGYTESTEAKRVGATARLEVDFTGHSNTQRRPLSPCSKMQKEWVQRKSLNSSTKLDLLGKPKELGSTGINSSKKNFSHLMAKWSNNSKNEISFCKKETSQRNSKTLSPSNAKVVSNTSNDTDKAIPLSFLNELLE